MNPLPLKFSRILIDGFWVLICFCGGRKQTANPSNSQPMEPISTLITQLDQAICCKAHWKEERRKLGSLIAPVTDWKLLASSNQVIILSKKIADRIDEYIPTQQLYVDLLKSAD